MPDRIKHKDTWIFDLDNTLYPAECNLFAQIDIHMGQYIQKLLELGPDEARIVQKKYLMQYGTTLKGLMAHHGVDPDDFLEKVHDIDFSPVTEDVRLRKALKRLSGRKIVFTNAHLDYAEQVLDRLGIADQFEDIFDIHAADLEPKPSQQAYDKFILKYDIIPQNSVMFEDMAGNLLPAHRMGMSTVWINTGSVWGDAGDEKDHIHYETTSLSRWLEKFTTELS